MVKEGNLSVRRGRSSFKNCWGVPNQINCVLFGFSGFGFNRLIAGLMRAGYLPTDFLTFEELARQADAGLFRAICSNPDHVLRHYFTLKNHTAIICVRVLTFSIFHRIFSQPLNKLYETRFETLFSNVCIDLLYNVHYLALAVISVESSFN